ncbi:hypothetical protein Clacol_009323 [Clathrus columnatus]|uniref:Ricin B lectin domain-containing protein n=1 Tax=Clathrus columnatus TaxID=1419009 RepID=A0AAV5ANH7_9AGAM|nr:hypothetical protein Clacol_009323 [Clathrus columnatus]
MKSSFKVLSALILLAASVSAQVPPYLGALLIEPGINSGKCLTAASNTDGAAVTIQTCTGAAAQQWTFSTSGTITIFQNKCLDVTNGANADGTKLQIWTCVNNSANQQWYYNFWVNQLSWKDKNKCLDLTDGSLNDGNKKTVQIWDCAWGNANQVWNTGYSYNNLPAKSESGQSGTNACGTDSSSSSMCQTVWINFAPPNPKGDIGDTERIEVAYCTKSGRGTRLIPDGTLKGVHFVKTPDYVQITGVGDLTKLNIIDGDAGGELDPHGADGNGNPIGGLVFGNSFGQSLQYHEWTMFVSAGQFCFRACVGPRAAQLCQHIYDEMGCDWVGFFKEQHALPMGVYGTSTWHQGISPTPPPHPVASSSSCTAIPTVSVSPVQRRSLGLEKHRYRKTH